MAITYKAARVNAGLTQKEAAKRLGVTVQSLCNYEKGRRVPKVVTVQKMCVAYGCKMDDIILPEISN